MTITLELITFVSLVVAVAMSAIAWRVVREERLRSNARVAALAAEIHERTSPNDLPLRAELMPMFATSSSHRPPSRLLLATVIVLIGGAVGASMVVLGGWAAGTGAAGRETPAANPAPAASAAPAREALPLQLVALGHERDADSLVVRGVLRNPANGVEVDALTAIVVLFDRDGGLIGTGRAAVEAARLLPGGETAFVVTVPGAGNVERYRVSFRNEEHVVPHVDQRRYTGLKAQA